MIVINQQSIKSKPIIQIKRIIVQTRGVSNYIKRMKKYLKINKLTSLLYDMIFFTKTFFIS